MCDLDFGISPSPDSLMMTMFNPSLQNMNAMNFLPDSVHGILSIIQPNIDRSFRLVVEFSSWYASNLLYSVTLPRWSSLVAVTTATLTAILCPDSLINFDFSP